MDIGHVQRAFTQGMFNKVEMCQIVKIYLGHEPL
jgi:hypothetical protein